MAGELERQLREIRRQIQAPVAVALDDHAKTIARAVAGANAQFQNSMALWKRQLTQPLLDILGPEWMPETEAFRDLTYPQMRAFWAEELGLIDRRRRYRWLGGAWMIRLSKKGWAEE